jgi:membrane-associated phospholipid phosphatase
VGPWRLSAARVTSEILAPVPVASALLVGAAWAGAASPMEAVRWATVAVAFAALAPAVYIAHGVRARRLTDRHVSRREQRPGPLLVGVASCLIGLALLAEAGAPRGLILLLVAMVVGLVAALLATLVWKVSLHTAVLAGAAVVLAYSLGWPALVACLLLVPLGWARVELGHHTPAQALAGTLLGAGSAAAVIMLLR